MPVIKKLLEAIALLRVISCLIRVKVIRELIEWSVIFLCCQSNTVLKTGNLLRKL
jgi:hypothetical protein